jgi:hypothetical protein
MIHDETLDAVRQRAKELAGEAPALTPQQALLLQSLWVRYPPISSSESVGVA